MDPILIVGPGAVGGVLAARWLLAGQKVAVLARTPLDERKLSQNKILFSEKTAPARKLKAALISARHSRPPSYRAAYFCVKSADTAAAIRAARPFIGAAIPVISLQNGLGHQRLLRRAFGPRRTVIGTAYFAADRPRPGQFLHNGGKDILLARQGPNAAALAAAREQLSLAGWSVKVKSSEERMLWTKLCFNAAVNGVGALCAEPNGRLASDPALREMIEAVSREACAVSTRIGRRPLYRSMEALVVRGCRNAPLQRNSTLQDLQARRRTEAPAIFGPLLEAARKTRTPAPRMTLISACLRRLERLKPG